MENIYTDAVQSSTTQDLPKFLSKITISSEPIDALGRIGSYVNFSARVLANKPSYQWFDKNGEPIPRRCQSNITIGPIKEEDFGFYRLQIKDELINQTVFTKWTELKRVAPAVIQPDVKEYQQLAPSLFRTAPLPQYTQPQGPLTRSIPQQEYQHDYLYQQCLQQQRHQHMAPKLQIRPDGGAYRRGTNINLTAHFDNAAHYQWSKDGVILVGCMGNTLVISNANLENTGDYRLVAYNSVDSSFVDTRVIIH